MLNQVMTQVFATGLKQDLVGFFETTGPVLFYLTVAALVFAGTALFLGIFIPFVTGDTLLFAAGLTWIVSGSADCWA